MTLNRFVASVNEKIALRTAPPEVLNNPLLLGQVVHKLTGGCSVYLMAAPESVGGATYVKIGVARNIRKRIDAIATGCPLPIKRVIYFCVTTYQLAHHLEQRLHREFGEYRVRGEWFYFADRQRLAGILPQMTERAEEWLGDDFNQFVFDPDHMQHPALPAVELFAKAIWGLSDDNVEIDVMMTDMAALTATSASRYERIELALSYRVGELKAC